MWHICMRVLQPCTRAAPSMSPHTLSPLRPLVQAHLLQGNGFFCGSQTFSGKALSVARRQGSACPAGGAFHRRIL